MYLLIKFFVFVSTDISLVTTHLTTRTIGGQHLHLSIHCETISHPKKQTSNPGNSYPYPLFWYLSIEYASSGVSFWPFPSLVHAL